MIIDTKIQIFIYVHQFRKRNPNNIKYFSFKIYCPI